MQAGWKDRLLVITTIITQQMDIEGSFQDGIERCSQKEEKRVVLHIKTMHAVYGRYRRSRMKIFHDGRHLFIYMYTLKIIRSLTL